jgi:non-homologous end joining protein Ku
MPRAMWTGAISFDGHRARKAVQRARPQGRALPPAVREERRAHRAEAGDPQSGEEVPYEEIVKGFEITPNGMC